MINNITFEKIRKLKNNYYGGRNHFVVYYDSGHYEYFIDLDIQKYQIENDKEEFYKVYNEFIFNGFFVASDVYDAVAVLKNKYYNMFYEHLFTDLYDLVNKVKKFKNKRDNIREQVKKYDIYKKQQYLKHDERQ